MRIYCLLSLLVAGICLTAPAVAQESEGVPVRIVMADGSQVVGTIESEDDTTVRFRTASGVVLDIPKAQIRSRRLLDGAIRDGEYLRLDPNRTRLLFMPTARSVGNGQGYFAAYELFFPFVAYGAGDAVTLAGGLSLLPFSPVQLGYVAPKVTFYQKRGNSVAAGVFAGTLVGDIGNDDDEFFDEVERPFFGILYGVGTVGDARKAVTLGAGMAFADGELADRPVLVVGGEYQLSNSVKLISENYGVPGYADSIVLSGGIRFFGDRLATDLAFFTTPTALDEGGFPFFPWLGFAYNFGR